MADDFLLLKFTIFTCLLGVAFSTLTFYNIECRSFDKDFADFDYCYITAVNRTLKTFSIKVKLFKVPITVISARFALSYRANGWKPFLYNYTVDACKFLKSKNKHVVINHVYKSFVEFSNMNHSCPYDHDIILNNFPSTFAEKMWTVALPLPVGDYRFYTTWIAYNIPRADAIFYVRVS